MSSEWVAHGGSRNREAVTMTTTLHLNYTTAAPRSAVIHALSLASRDPRGHVTECGRAIGEEWAGEYSETPVGGVTCRRCLPAVVLADHDRALTENGHRDAAVFAVGDRVGIMVGVQAVGGPVVSEFGDVVGIVSEWSGPVEFLVVTASGERLIFTRHLLTRIPRTVDADHEDALEEWATRGTVSLYRVLFTRVGFSGAGKGWEVASCLTSDGYSTPDGFPVMLGHQYGPVTVHAYALVAVNDRPVPFRGLVIVGEQPAGCAECSATLPDDGVCRVCDPVVTCSTPYGLCTMADGHDGRHDWQD